MDEEKVKSALELAMERLSSMPELTREEIAQQKKIQFQPVGQAIGRRYLAGMVDDRGMLEELARHGAESGRIVRSACIATLCASIRVEDILAAGRAIAGLSRLAGSPEAFQQEAGSSWDRLRGECGKREEDTIRKFESAVRETFSSIGISGSAMRPNLRGNESFQAELESVRRSFDRELAEFRTELAEKIEREEA